MLQEDFSNPITRLLALHACDLHWRNTAMGVAEREAEKEAQRLEQEAKDVDEVGI